MIRIEETVHGDLREHRFNDEGFDLWGYDAEGRYNSQFDRAPFQNSPFWTEDSAELGFTRPANPVGPVSGTAS